MQKLTVATKKSVMRSFVQTCLKEGVTEAPEMIQFAMHTLRGINKDVVAGYKASNARKKHSRKRSRS